VRRCSRADSCARHFVGEGVNLRYDARPVIGASGVGS
jgi:hypothetical protein